jgi:hypothetical protein
MVRGPRSAAVALLVALAPAAATGADAQLDRAARALAGDASLKVRTQAAIVLGQRGARDDVPALSRALQEDAAPPVRVAAAYALGRIHVAAGEAALREAQARDSDAAVRAAAGRALEELRHGARSVVLEDVAGSAGDARARSALQSALAAELKRRGFSLVGRDGGAGWRLKPAVLAVDVRQGGGTLKVEVKASVIAVDAEGHIAAMVEGGARVRSPGAPPASAVPMTAKALEAAASSICDDLASRLLAIQ